MNGELTIKALKKQNRKLVRSLKAVRCSCSLKEILSGHRVDCFMPQIEQALKKVGE